MQDFHQLDVWRKAHGLVPEVYTSSKDLPSSENFGRVLHLRRSAVWIARAIAEGCGRSSDAEFSLDLKKARAAGRGLEYIILPCRDLGFLPDARHDDLQAELLEVRKMISGLVKRLGTPLVPLR